MLQSIDQLYGDKIVASDGEIGRVKDFYFDDQCWAVRYVVVDTDAWLPGRKVMIFPHAIDGLDPTGKALRVNLTQKQIEDSPSIALHEPVSRQFEEEYYRHYGLPFYWQDGALWGVGSSPVAGSRAATLPAGLHPGQANPHLRSTQAVGGYQIGTKDGMIGHVSDFILDDHDWAIGQLVIKTGHRFTGTEVLIPTRTVDRISYPDSTVFVSLTSEAVEQSPARKLAPVGVAD